MATVNLGRIKPQWQGNYASETSYVIDDMVLYNNSAYICTAASQGNAPTDTSYWDLMTQGISAGSVTANEIADGAVTAAKLSETYLTPTGDGSSLTGIDATPYDSGWITASSNFGHYSADYGPVKYRRVGNIVTIIGITAGGTGISNGQVIFTLPAGFRPSHTFLIATQADNGLGRMDVDSNGDVIADTAAYDGWFSCACTFITNDPVSTHWNS